MLKKRDGDQIVSFGPEDQIQVGDTLTAKSIVTTHKMGQARNDADYVPNLGFKRK